MVVHSAAAVVANSLLKAPGISDYFEAFRTPDQPLSLKDRACWETTRRLLASLVNEGLVEYTYLKQEHFLALRRHDVTKNVGPKRTRGSGRCRPRPVACPALLVRVRPNSLSAGGLASSSAAVCAYVDPDDLVAPAYIHRSFVGKVERELHPAALFRCIRPWLGAQDPAVVERIIQELESSAANQEFLFRYSGSIPPPSLTSTAMDWERAVITGHPTHPMHKSCVAEEPLTPVTPSDLFSLVWPTISVLSLPRQDLRITGPFEETIRPLLPLNLLEFQNTCDDGDDRVLVPALSRQVPSILQRFPSARLVSEGALKAEAQVAMRTVKPLLPAENSANGDVYFPHCLKFPLACRITSALRTVTPWTSTIGPEVSRILGPLFPDAIWLAKEVASVTGSHQDFDEAKHLGCIIREDPEARARERGETVIVCASLVEKVGGIGLTHVERVFELDSVDKKMAWLKKYTSILFSGALGLLRDCGIVLEAHGQNMLVRVLLTTGEPTGFVARDCGGIKIHAPTLSRKQGVVLRDVLPGSLVVTDNLDECYKLAFHTLVQCHIHRLVRALGLETLGGWHIVREELDRFCDQDPEAEPIRNFCKREKIPMKCFMRMKLDGLYRDYIHRDVPNVLLS